MPASLSTPAPAPPATEAITSAAGLPVQLTRIIGREREIASLQELLTSTRLLTLTGAGGSGKTRLALEVAARVAAEYAHRVQWIELAPLSDPTFLPSEVSNHLGIREEPGRTPVQRLIEFLKPRSLLLVLDNCEHVVDACASLTEALLREAPALKVLATSREALGIPGEIAWIVPPLTLPQAHAPLTAQEVSRSEAAQLFRERARGVLPSFALTDQNAAAVAQICRRLDGVPLAIELAAARVKVLTPEQIAGRLDDAFGLLTSGSRTALPRHRTLRATIDWSYRLLSEPEQLLLQRLSVFAGGFALEAAEAVCVDERLEAWQVLDLLAQLVDRSLVVMREEAGVARYHLLETVRQYARERLASAGETVALQRRHAEFFLERIEEAEPHLVSPERDAWNERLRAEHDNLRAALAWSARSAEEINLRMAGGLYWFWFLLGFWSEGRRWLAGALALPAARERSAARAKALLSAGTLAFWTGDVGPGRRWLEESREIWGELGDSSRQAYASLYVGMCTLSLTRNPALARPAMETAVAGFEKADDRWGLTHAYNCLATLPLLQQELAAAKEVYEKNITIAREVGENIALSIALHGVGVIARQQGELDRAAEAFREAIAVRRHEYDELFLARTLEALAFLLLERGDAREAARLFGAAQSLRERVGAPVLEWDTPHYSESGVAMMARAGEESFAAALAEGRALTREQAIALALREPLSLTPPSIPAPPAATAEPPAAAESVRTAPALRVLALGPLHIYRGGELLPPEAWGSAKPRELLLFLLCHPQGCAKEQAGLALWPDASPTQLRNNFHTTLHRLRKALGEGEWISLSGDRYRIAPEPGYEFDAALFEREVTAALREHRTGGAGAERLQAALALYRGDFLEGEVIGDWHLETRDRLRQLCVTGMLALGEHLVGAGDYAEAADLYRRVIVREPLAEEAYRRLMLCHTRLGERAQALRLYQRLSELLREELATEPDEETTELYERLQRGEVP